MIRSEFDIIRQYFTQQPISRDDVALGIGDDAALLSPPAGQELVVTVDTLVAGVHFSPAISPQNLGHKALAVNLSDLAAMGAEPTWVTLALTLPQADEKWLDGFARGFFHLAQLYDVQLVGGDTTRGPLCISVQAMGLVPEKHALTRSGAQAGDGIYVTGSLGDAGAGLLIQKAKQVANEAVTGALLGRLEHPEPRVTAGYMLHGLASAAIDISDGLAADLNHILEARGVGADIRISALPLSAEFLSLQLENAWQFAVSAGEDYELCFTVPPAHEAEIREHFSALGCPLACIGEISSKPGMRWLNDEGRAFSLTKYGYDHFAQNEVS